MTHYIELHKAKEMFGVISKNMNLISNLKINPILKDAILGDLNKTKQWLSLRNLKTMKEE